MFYVSEMDDSFLKSRIDYDRKEYLKNNYIEGIVFYRGNGEMCKIKRSDFGFRWKQ